MQTQLHRCIPLLIATLMNVIAVSAEFGYYFDNVTADNITSAFLPLVILLFFVKLVINCWYTFIFQEICIKQSNSICCNVMKKQLNQFKIKDFFCNAIKSVELF